MAYRVFRSRSAPWLRTRPQVISTRGWLISGIARRRHVEVSRAEIVDLLQEAVSSILTLDKTAAQRPDRDRIVVTFSTTVTKRDITVVVAAATWRPRLTLDCRPGVEVAERAIKQ